MNESELEDIESHLYSQVYHSNEGIEQDLSTVSFEAVQEPAESIPRPIDNMQRPSRYFQGGLKSARNKFPNQHFLQVQSTTKSLAYNEHNQPQGFYSKSCTIPHKPDISINQLVVLSSPQQNPIVCLAGSSRLNRKARWKAKLKEKKRQKLIAKFANHPPQNKINEKQDIKKIECDIITLSDSDDDSCVVIPKNWPTLCVADSDDDAPADLTPETKVDSNEATSKNDINVSTTSVDDVIFVETANVSIEVINLDEEVECNTEKNCDEVNTHVDVETGSVTSSNNSFLNSPTKSKSTKQLHQERKQLLSTPDSASNDFMGNSGVDLNQENFNFSLHGADFNNREFRKPANPTETCETESTSSTTDMNALKIAVFNEIEFPKEDIFAEANLESFGNFITPRRSASSGTVRSLTPTEKLTDKGLEKQHQNVYSSDSSSESDFEETAIDKQRETFKKSKNLPDLSPMLLQSVSHVKKKAKKLTNLCSKYDLINATSLPIVKQAKQKKRKSVSIVEVANLEASFLKKRNKNKKKNNKESCVDASQSSEIASDTNSAETTVIQNDINKTGLNVDRSIEPNVDAVEGETKQKKRRSNQMSDDNADNSESNQSKKKIKIKKKKDDGVNDAQSPIPLQPDPVDDTPKIDENSDKAEAPGTCSPENVEPEKTNEQDEMQSDVPVVLEPNCLVQTQQENFTATDKFVANSAETDGKVREDDGQNFEDMLDEDLIVVDECVESVVLSSDSESNLSPLNGPQDIQLGNCKKPQSDYNNAPSTSTQGVKNDVNLKDSSTEEVQQTMSSDPKLWAILDSDVMQFRAEGKVRRCNKCREKGHMAIRCPNMVVPKCRLCGDRGHYEPRCPNRICTQCGQRSSYSTTYCKYCFKFRNHQCQICSMMGHAANTCPDLWRRYHSTTLKQTADGPLTMCNGPMLKPKSQLWCSGCAQSGHLEYACRYYKSPYPPADPHIKSYENVYSNNARPREHMRQIGRPLHYRANSDQRTQHNGHYPMQRQAQPRYPTSYYNHGNNYRINPVNNIGFRNVYPENMTFIVNNQDHLLQGVAGNAFQQPPSDTSYPRGNLNPFCFEDNLPNFISFESQPDNNYRQVPNTISSENQFINVDESVQDQASNTITKTLPVVEFQSPVRQHNNVFFSSATQNIQQFISNELRQLTILSYRANSVVKNLKKKPIPTGSKSKVRYYRTLNMVLFGIFHLNDGKLHLDKLKKFKMKHIKTKLSQTRRQELYRSYSYIFGVRRQGGVDYNELLRRI